VNCYVTLSNKSRGGAGLILPGGGQDTLGLVIPSKTMDPRLHQNEPELSVLVLPVPLQMLPDGDSFLDEKVNILR